jgi:RNA polymerase sigma-70 factor (ECF subfamily)
LERPFAPWLLRLATNVCINESRRTPAHCVSLEETAEDGEPRALPDPGLSPERELELSELKQHVQKAIECLPGRYRVAIVLRHMEGLDYDEIAQIMNLPLGTVKTFMHRGREQLREILAAYLKGGE